MAVPENPCCCCRCCRTGEWVEHPGSSRKWEMASFLLSAAPRTMLSWGGSGFVVSIISLLQILSSVVFLAMDIFSPLFSSGCWLGKWLFRQRGEKGPRTSRLQKPQDHANISPRWHLCRFFRESSCRCSQVRAWCYGFWEFLRFFDLYSNGILWRLVKKEKKGSFQKV